MEQTEKELVADALESLREMVSTLSAQLAVRDALMVLLLRELAHQGVVNNPQLIKGLALVAEVTDDIDMRHQFDELTEQLSALV